jgi:Uma2 family endonuclease
MLAPRPSPALSVEEFLAFVDEHPGEKWELIDGAPVAMAGGTLRHALIGANLAFALDGAARPRGCRALRDMFFRIAANDGHVFDPDVMIRCGPTGDLLTRTIDDAGAVFEVLSPSTMTRDRGVKLDGYMQAASLRQIVLVYPGEYRVESWTRDAEVAWPEEPRVLASPSAGLDVPLIGASISLASIYEGVDFAA